MDIIKRILLESRYIISLNKSINELVPIMNIEEETIYDDINFKLKKFDTELYERVISVLYKKS